MHAGCYCPGEKEPQSNNEQFWKCPQNTKLRQDSERHMAMCKYMSITQIPQKHQHILTYYFENKGENTPVLHRHDLHAKFSLSA